MVSFHPLQWQPFLLNRKGTRSFFFFLTNEYFHWGNKKQPMALRIHFYERDLTLGWFQYHFIMLLLESKMKNYFHLCIWSWKLWVVRELFYLLQQPKHPLKSNWTKVYTTKKQKHLNSSNFYFPEFPWQK